MVRHALHIGATRPDRTGPWLTDLRAVAVLILVTVVAFLGVLDNEFVNWDDFEVIVDNPHYRGFDVERLRWMFTTSHAGHYQPLTWMSYAVDAAVWGGVSATGVHLTNLALHVITAVFFYLVSRELLATAARGGATGSGVESKRTQSLRDGREDGSLFTVAGALTAALLFAVHPLRVESVAWATERRDVLSGAWLMAAVWLYLRQATAGDGHGRARMLAGSWICYVLSLLSKAAGVPLPAVLLMLDVYPLRRLRRSGRSVRSGVPSAAASAEGSGAVGTFTGDQRRRRHGGSLGRVLLEKVLYAAPAGVFAMTAIWAQRDAGAMRSLAEHDLSSRIAQALFGLAFYVGKSVWPATLLPLYEWPDEASPWDARVLVSAALVFALAAAAWTWRRRCPAVAVALGCYVALVSPVLGVAQSGPQMAADRYTYLSMMPWAIVAGSGVAAIVRQRRRTRASAAPIAVAVIAATLLLAAMTRAQVRVWRTPESLWTHMIENNPQHPKGWSGLAGALRRQATVTGDLDLIRRAAEYYDRAILLRPDMLAPHVGAGLCAADLGDLDAAERHYRDALAIQPSDEDALRGLAHVLGTAGKFDEADRAYAALFEAVPLAADAHYAYANLLARQGRYAEAGRHFQIVTVRGGEKTAAMVVDAWYGLAVARAESGEEAGAIAALRSGLTADPDHVLIHAKLAWVLATSNDPACRDPQQALRLARRAVELSEGGSIAADESLAAAQAALGDFDAAVATLDARLGATGADRPAWADRLEAQRDAYQRRQLWRP